MRFQSAFSLCRHSRIINRRVEDAIQSGSKERRLLSRQGMGRHGVRLLRPSRLHPRRSVEAGEGGERAFDQVARQIPDDEDDAGRTVVVRPLQEMIRRMDETLWTTTGLEPVPTLSMPFTRRMSAPWECSSMVNQMPKAVQFSGCAKRRQNE